MKRLDQFLFSFCFYFILCCLLSKFTIYSSLNAYFFFKKNESGVNQKKEKITSKLSEKFLFFGKMKVKIRSKTDFLDTILFQEPSCSFWLTEFLPDN